MISQWKIGVGVGLIILAYVAVAFAADNLLKFDNVSVTVHSKFKGATVMGMIPAPAEYGPDVQFNPVDPGNTVFIGSFPVSTSRKVRVWDVVPDPTVPSVTAECGPIFSDVKEITINVVGNYNPNKGGGIQCNIQKIK